VRPVATEVHKPKDARTRSDEALSAYLAPILAFGVMTALEPWIPLEYYPAIYAAKIGAVLVCFAVWRQWLADLRLSGTPVVASVMVGLGVCAMWVFLEESVPYPHMGARVGFDPDSIDSDGGRLAFLLVRFFGLVVVVPLMEELFWRSLALRYLTAQDFLSVPIGRFTRRAFLVMVAGFALTHTEWLAAAITAVVYGAWVWRTRSLLGVVIAHATTNAALGIYVLTTGRFYYW
jgi:CAAX protease family protein